MTAKRNFYQQPTTTPADLSNYVFGKVQPQALPLEEAVLGAIMTDRNAYETASAVFENNADPFYSEANGLIWRAMTALHNTQRPIDLLTVMEQLKATGDLQTIGGPAYLADLTHRVASAANLEYHARIVWEKAIRRNLAAHSTDILRGVYDDTLDTVELLETAEAGMLSVTQGIGGQDAQSITEIAAESLRQLGEIRANPKKVVGVRTPTVYLTKLTGGWQRTDLILIAARPSMGKTAFMLNSARSAAGDGSGVGIFSLEMSKIQLVNRLAAQECGISNSEFRNVNNLSSLEFAKIQRGMEIVSGYRIQIDDTPGITITALRRKARQMVRKGASLILVDYLQLMSGGPDGSKGNREQEISSISRGLKALAKELNVPVIALSQLSRAVETRGGTKRPQLSDLRESGALEQDADIVGFLYRPEYYGIKEDENGNSLEGKALLIIAKHRNGALDDVAMNFDKPTATFFDPDTVFEQAASPFIDTAQGLSTAMKNAIKMSDDDVDPDNFPF